MNTDAAAFVPNRLRPPPTVINITLTCATGCPGGTACNCVTFLHVPSQDCSCETCRAFAIRWSTASPPAPWPPAGAAPARTGAASTAPLLPLSTHRQYSSGEDQVANNCWDACNPCDNCEDGPPHAAPLGDACSCRDEDCEDCGYFSDFGDSNYENTSNGYESD